ncbi:hypothetical protein H6P81_017189 [Aristolochia fimbriata]|uniref:VOC domain-containing protein n=1 Tax=Aristolochia fimbriata TaxID=158543 RepID=A0AAV7DXF6_ARIFI|nr:hypothetical protein H6P81_017189 [Aristolochia fimbriata]
MALKCQICVPGSKAEEAISFYKSAFGAEELKRARNSKSNGEFLCSELNIGGTVFILCNETPECSTGCCSCFCLQMEDLEAAFANAIKAGAIVEREIGENESGLCCGSRYGKLKDPYGNVWAICSAENRCCGAAVSAC